MIDEVTQAWFNAGAPGPGLLRRADEVAEINAANGDISHPAILAGAPQALSTTAFQVVPRLAAAALAVRLAAMSSEDLPLAEFGFPGPLRDQLVAAILAGDKITTTGLVADYEIGNEPLPRPGLREAVVDSAGKPVAVIETTAVRVIRLGDVDLPHALGEGEGYVSVSEWRAGHERFWQSAEMREALGDPEFTVDDDTLVVAQTFRLAEN
jgi:uncharacterized protein YhfF